MPSRERSSSQNRSEESARSRMIRRVHLPEMTSAVRQTGHSRSNTRPRIASKLYFVKRCPGSVRRLRAGHVLDPRDLQVVGLAVGTVEEVSARSGGEAKKLASVGTRETGAIASHA